MHMNYKYLLHILNYSSTIILLKINKWQQNSMYNILIMLTSLTVLAGSALYFLCRCVCLFYQKLKWTERQCASATHLMIQQHLFVWEALTATGAFTHSSLLVAWRTCAFTHEELRWNYRVEALQPESKM